MTGPVLVDAFAGGGGFWLASVADGLTPPVSWMGGKRRLARDLLALLDLRPGCRLPLILGDSSWWGWVWPTVLDVETGPRVSEILRGWRGEDPRALWFRLRDMGPITDDVAGAAAQLLWLQARAASGVPVWWEGGEVVSMDGHGRGPYRAWQAMCGADPSPDAEPSPTVDGAGQETRGANGKGVHGGQGRLVQWASTAVDGAGQRQATEPRLLAQSGPRADGSRGVCAASMSGDKAMLLASDGRGVPRECGHKGRDSRAGGGIVDPGTIAGRLDAIRVAVDGIDITIDRLDARAFAEKWAPVLGRRAVVYLDPPYQGATGYPSTCPRAEVLAIAEIWARHGARVVLSEAVGLAADLGAGWSQVELTQGRKPEWATVYGCDVRAVLPPLLRMGAA